MLTRLIRWCRVVDAMVAIGDIRDRIRAVSSSVDLAEMEIADLSRHLRRARDAIAVLYVGTRSRRPDGTVDVDAVIDSVLGEA
jgi:hypothetical protein